MGNHGTFFTRANTLSHACPLLYIALYVLMCQNFCAFAVTSDGLFSSNQDAARELKGVALKSIYINALYFPFKVTLNSIAITTLDN